MRIQLETVDFDHRPGGAASDALSMRVDRLTPAAPWRRGGAATSYAAYALWPTQGRQLAIEATFSFTGPVGAASTAMVRARPLNDALAVLGTAGPAAVRITAPGAGNPVAVLPLNEVRIAEKGVGRYAVAWQWQVQWSPDQAWIDFDRSAHVVYVTLDRPGPPWTNNPATPNQFLWPWAIVLDWACEWARGISATTTGASLSAALHEAALHVESHVHALGTRRHSPVTYGGAKFTDATGRSFRLTEFVELLHGRPAVGPHGRPLLHSVNCSDCTAAVTTFANILGGDLTAHRIQPSQGTFDTNPILPIGFRAATPQMRFTFHEVAVRRAAAPENFAVHDACLRIDFDASPAASPPADFRLSAGLPRGAFGVNQPIEYVQRLVADSRGFRGADVGVRWPDQCVPGVPPDAVVDRWRSFRDQIDLGAAPSELSPAFLEHPIDLPGFRVYQQNDNPWQMSAIEEVKQASEFLYVAGTAQDHGAEQTTAPDDRLLRVLVGCSDTRHLARDAFAWLLAQSHEPLHAVPTSGPSDASVAFMAAEERTAFIARGRVFARITSEGVMAVSLVEVLGRVDKAFQMATAS